MFIYREVMRKKELTDVVQTANLIICIDVHNKYVALIKKKFLGLPCGHTHYFLSAKVKKRVCYDPISTL